MSVLKNKVLNAIPRDDSREEVRVWDMFIESWDEDHPGRVRIVALIPRQPNPLVNIPFAIAWCNPEDTKQYSKNQANLIAAGRLTKMLKSWREPGGALYPYGSKNCAIIHYLDTLKGFHEQCFLNVLEVPHWVFPNQFESDELNNRILENAFKYKMIPEWGKALLPVETKLAFEFKGETK